MTVNAVRVNMHSEKSFSSSFEPIPLENTENYRTWLKMKMLLLLHFWVFYDALNEQFFLKW